ncbi:hypothetical protein BH10PSE16_BH10PSE16_01920 [soil metagenome]
MTALKAAPALPILLRPSAYNLPDRLRRKQARRASD